MYRPGARGGRDEGGSRPAAGDPEPADPEDAVARAAARVGDLEADPGGVRGGAERGAGVALPGALPAGGAGVDRLRVGRFPGGAAGEVLLAHAGGGEAAGGRERELAPLLARGRAR